MVAVIVVPLVWAVLQVLQRTHAATLNCRQPKPCAASSFASVLPAGASIEKVVSVPNGGSYGEGASDLGYPGSALNLPPVCAVTVRVVAGKSRYRFGLFLPSAANWNSKFLAVGGYSQG
jgi:feruloyl esterase